MYNGLVSKETEMSTFVKVKHPGLKKAIYLENPKITVRGDYTFISGYVCNKNGDGKVVKGGSVLHLLQVGEGVEIIPQKFNNKYAELEDAPFDPVTERNQPLTTFEPAPMQRIHHADGRVTCLA